MAQFAQGLGFNLANTLTGDVKLFADFFQGTAATVIETETQLEHFALALGQAIEDILHLLFEQLMAGRVGGSEGSVVLDKGAQGAIVPFTDGSLQANRLLADLDDLAYFFRAN